MEMEWMELRSSVAVKTKSLANNFVPPDPSALPGSRLLFTNECCHVEFLGVVLTGLGLFVLLTQHWKCWGSLRSVTAEAVTYR